MATHKSNVEIPADWIREIESKPDDKIFRPKEKDLEKIDPFITEYYEKKGKHALQKILVKEFPNIKDHWIKDRYAKIKFGLK